MATAHDKYVPDPHSLDLRWQVRRFVGLTLAVLASVAIGMPLHVRRFDTLSWSALIRKWDMFGKANLLETRVELCHYKKGVYSDSIMKSNMLIVRTESDTILRPSRIRRWWIQIYPESALVVRDYHSYVHVPLFGENFRTYVTPQSLSEN